MTPRRLAVVVPCCAPAELAKNATSAAATARAVSANFLFIELSDGGFAVMRRRRRVAGTIAKARAIPIRSLCAVALALRQRYQGVAGQLITRPTRSTRCRPTRSLPRRLRE